MRYNTKDQSPPHPPSPPSAGLQTEKNCKNRRNMKRFMHFPYRFRNIDAWCFTRVAVADVSKWKEDKEKKEEDEIGISLFD